MGVRENEESNTEETNSESMRKKRCRDDERELGE